MNMVYAQLYQMTGECVMRCVGHAREGRECVVCGTPLGLRPRTMTGLKVEWQLCKCEKGHSFWVTPKGAEVLSLLGTRRAWKAEGVRPSPSPE